MKHMIAVALGVVALVSPLKASAQAAPIDPLPWLQGCAALTQPGPFATIMDQTCARVAIDYCRTGRSGANLDNCLDQLHAWLSHAADGLATAVPGGDGQREIETHMFEELTDPETCPFEPPLGADKRAYCRAVFAGIHWHSWRDAARRAED